MLLDFLFKSGELQFAAGECIHIGLLHAHGQNGSLAGIAQCFGPLKSERSNAVLVVALACRSVNGYQAFTRKEAAARALGISRRALYRLLDRYHLRDQAGPGEGKSDSPPVE